MRSIEATGKKLDDAIKSGLEQLGVTIDDVDVKIISRGGWLSKAKVLLTVDEEAMELNRAIREGKLGVEEEKPFKKERPERPRQEKKEFKSERPARPEKKEFEKKERPVRPEKKQEVLAQKPIETAPKAEVTAPAELPEVTEEVAPVEVKPVAPEQVELARSYLTEIFAKMGVEAQLVINTDKGSIDVDIVTEDASVIGHHGEVLDAIQQLCKRAVEEGEDKHLQVNLDCKGYRAHREKTLMALAGRMASKAAKTGRKVVLEPMNNTERKIIHATLNDDSRVFTKSDGHEPNRRVVIVPKRSARRNNNYRGKGYRNNAHAATESAPEVTPTEE